MGVPTSLIRERLRKCQVLVVESNHDERMLKDAERPWHLKQRIMGRQGHLSNARAAEMLAEVATPALHTVFLAHLSEECNRPDLAKKTTHDMLLKHGHAHVNVQVACQDTVSEMWSYSAAG
jgi:phosphoribosyl 1,2-cyclic phosphodiesterase